MTNRDKLNKLYMKDCQEIIAMSNNELVGKAMINCGFSTKFCYFILSLGFSGHTWDEDDLLCWLRKEVDE